jgi:hypothetical protein
MDINVYLTFDDRKTVTVNEQFFLSAEKKKFFQNQKIFMNKQ